MAKTPRLYFLVAVCCINSSVSFNHIQAQTLKFSIEQIIEAAKGKVGVGVLNIETREMFTIHAAGHYPMQSVYKFPLAMAILAQVDKGRFSLDQKIHVTKEDLHPNTWSPMREKYPEGNIDLPLRDLILFSVSQSDNNACDLLFRMAGGTRKVNDYVHNTLGIRQISIATTELEMAQGLPVQYMNWCQPDAMLQMLDVFYHRKKLSASSSEFLWQAMTGTALGLKRIKGLLPANVVVAHKTGTSPTADKTGITGATNDVGIITLPNGKHIAVVVFVSDSPENLTVREGVIAKTAKTVWDYYTGKN